MKKRYGMAVTLSLMLFVCKVSAAVNLLGGNSGFDTQKPVSVTCDATNKWDTTDFPGLTFFVFGNSSVTCSVKADASAPSSPNIFEMKSANNGGAKTGLCSYPKEPVARPAHAYRLIFQARSLSASPDALIGYMKWAAPIKRGWISEPTQTIQLSANWQKFTIDSGAAPANATNIDFNVFSNSPASFDIELDSFQIFDLTTPMATPLPKTVATPPPAFVAPGVKMNKDLYYTQDKEEQRALDLYLPENAKAGKRLPLIILIHGGGWIAGTKESFSGPANDFVKHGYAAASLNYRLSDQAIFPAQAIDCKAAVRWLRAHAEQYGLDPKRFVAAGHSAGGHLAALLAVINGRKEFDQGDNLDFNSDVQAALWMAGVGDLVTRVLTPGYENEANANSGQSMLIGGAVLANQDKALRASPIHYVGKQTAPIIFFHGDRDELVPVSQAIDMYVALERAGILAELHILKNAGHGGDGQYWTPLMYRQIDDFLHKVFKAKSE